MQGDRFTSGVPCVGMSAYNDEANTRSSVGQRRPVAERAGGGGHPVVFNDGVVMLHSILCESLPRSIRDSM